MTSKRLKHRRAAVKARRTKGAPVDNSAGSTNENTDGNKKGGKKSSSVTRTTRGVGGRRTRTIKRGTPQTQATTEPDKVRVSKLMAARGMCSRREADTYIEQGWVYVDGVKIEALGTRIDEDQKITLSRAGEKRQERRVTVLLHKPPGFVSGQPEKGYAAAATLVKPSNYVQFRGAQQNPPPRLRDLAPAGRLDIESEGLLVLTQDGRIARTLIGPESSIEKEYLVRVEGEITEQRIERLTHGLMLDGRALRPAKIEKRAGPNLRFILTEGRKRQIRRMCELVDLKVIRLQRVRIGDLKLGRLPPGKWRYLRQHESF